MARQEYILSVFVASPSDVEDERNRLEEVIRDLNTAWARELGIRLELVRWETHAYPSFGADAQAVINQQIPDDYDLFIGVMWYRFGTPTGRAGSGTIEEFRRAKARFDRDSSIQLMIYFKDAPAPVAPTKLDHAQIAKVAEFRASLGDEGGLHWSFTSVEEFEKLMRLHLTRQVQAWRDKHAIAGQLEPTINRPAETSVGASTLSTDQDEEPGLIDLMEQFEDEFATVVEICERIAAATVEMGEKMQVRTREVQAMSGSESTNRKVAKRLIARAAADMDQFVHRMEAELPLFSQHLSTGMNALIHGAAIAVELTIDAEAQEQIKDSLEGIRTFHETLTVVEGQIRGFQQAVASVPRMTTVLNRSKRAMVNVLQRLIDEFRSGQAMAREAESSFASIVK